LRMTGEREMLEILNHVHAREGYTRAKISVLEKKLGRLKENSRREYVWPLHFALLCAELGYKDRAFEWLDKAYEAREWLLIVNTAPAFDSLRSDPRFTALLKKIGLPSEIVLPG
jgi:hypothetical protein